MIVIAAKVKLSDEDFPKYLDRSKDLIVKSRHEEGCNNYCFALDTSEGNTIRISEEWNTEQDFQNHLAAPHTQQFLSDVSQMEILEMRARRYEVHDAADMVPL